MGFGRRFRRITVGVLVGSLAALLAAAPANATGTLDQYYPGDVSESSGWTIYSSQYIGQVFTGGTTGYLDQVDFYGFGLSGALVIDVFAVSGGYPSGAALASETLTIACCTTSWHTVTLDPAVAVSAGTQYVVVLSGGEALAFAWTQLAPAYTGGATIMWHPSGGWQTVSALGGVGFKTYVTPTVDGDGDGHGSTDCNDSDNTIYPGATEIANDGIDQDCTGSDLVTFYADYDGDGYGDPGTTQDAESTPVGHVADSTDCDDTDADVNPSATEVANDGVDQNCNGYDQITYYTDADLDTYGVTSTATDVDGAQPTVTATRGGDADDTDPTVYPAAPELCDGKDNDQGGTVDDGWPDTDGDTIADCVDPDDDGDGIPDGEDPDGVAQVVVDSTTAISSGNRKAFLKRLDYVESLIGDGDTEDAVTELESLRKRTDGCGTKADKNDWITDCEDQQTVRALIDDLIANLTGT